MTRWYPLGPPYGPDEAPFGHEETDEKTGLIAWLRRYIPIG